MESRAWRVRWEPLVWRDGESRRCGAYVGSSGVEGVFAQ